MAAYHSFRTNNGRKTVFEIPVRDSDKTVPGLVLFLFDACTRWNQSQPEESRIQYSVVTKTEAKDQATDVF